MSTRPTLLPDADVASALRSLPGWRHEGHKLLRRYDFGDFSRATACLAGLAVAAAELDHHPAWSGVYGRLELELWTHDRGGVTELDLALARRAAALAHALGAS
jgi:4a-hydroxytetrahydrobiopterin dehydratase